MTTVNFNLKDSSSKDETLIHLIFYFNGQRFKFSTGEKITPKHWNLKTQRVRQSFRDSSDLNDYLDSLEKSLEKIYRNAVTKGTQVTPDFLRGELLKVSQKENTDVKGFFDYLTEYYNLKEGKVTFNYLKKVNTLKNTLTEFQREKKYKLTFDSINLNFYDKFTTYLLNDRKKRSGDKTVVYKGMLNNSVGSNISILKTFLEWATKRGHNSTMTYKDKEFKSYKGENDIIYLTERELMHLFEFDLSDYKRLEGVRDTFCFSCFTGLRYSDVSKVKKENIKGDELKIVTEKTTDKLTIPLNIFAKEILERNNYRLPVISNQKTNEYLKELTKIAEINEPVLITKFRGVKRIEIEKPKHDFISTHTGRRTFCTLSLEKGMRAETVMAITGHKDYRSFKKYIKITDKIKRIEMNVIWKREPKGQMIAV